MGEVPTRFELSPVRAKWFDARIEEYKILWTEVVESMSHQQSILSFGVAGVALLTASSFTIWSSLPRLASFVLVVLVPLLAYMVVVLWVGEIARMMRGAVYMCKIEEELAAAFERLGVADPPLGYQRWINAADPTGSTNQLRSFYAAMLIGGLASDVALVSLGLRHSQLHGLRLIAAIGVELVGALAIGAFIRHTGFRFRVRGGKDA